MSIRVPRLSDHDENLFATPDHRIFAKLQAAVAGAFAGLDVVFITMPGADEMQLVGKGLAFIGAIGGDDVHHFVDQDAFARRAAGMDAIIAVGVILPVLEEHADLVLAGDHDPALAILEIGRLGDKAFGHLSSLPLVPAGLSRISQTTAGCSANSPSNRGSGASRQPPTRFRGLPGSL